MAKCTDAGVVEIRREHAEGKSYGAIAKDRDLSRATIKRICKGKSWKHIALAAQATTPPPVRAVPVEIEDDGDDSGQFTTCADQQDVCEAPADWVKVKPAE
jgi:hypothetical protein